MKITILSILEHEIEVDEKFDLLADNNPQFIGYSEKEELLDELKKEIYRQIGFRFVDEKGLNNNDPKITNVDTDNGGTIFEW